MKWFWLVEVVVVRLLWCRGFDIWWVVAIVGVVRVVVGLMVRLNVVVEGVSWPQGPSHVVWDGLKCIDVPVTVSV